MRKLLQSKSGTALVYAGFFALFGWLLVRNSEAVEIRRWENVGILPVMMVLTAVVVTGRGMVNVLTFRREGTGIRFPQGFQLAILNTVGNYLPFSAGLVAKGIVLKRSFGVPYKSYTLISAYTFAAMLGAGGLTGLFALYWLGGGNAVLWGLFGGMACLPAIVQIPIGRLPLLSWLRYADKADAIRRSFHGIQGPVLLLNLAMIAVLATRLGLAFEMLGHGLPFAHVLLLASGGILNRMLTLTPGGIGIREGIVAVLGHLTGLNYELIVLAAGLDRLAGIVTLFPAAGVILLKDRKFRGVAAEQPPAVSESAAR